MANRKVHTIFSILIFMLISSCGTVKLPHGKYKNIGKMYNYKRIDSDYCKVNMYYHKFLFLKAKKLNGKYCIDDDTSIMCAEFTDGILNGEYFVYDNMDKNILTEEGSYINGLLDGINYKYYSAIYSKEDIKVKATSKKTYTSGYIDGFVEIYEDNHLIRKSHYKNSIKDGYEYYFSKKGDTLKAVHYTFNPDYKSNKKISEMNINFSNSSNKGLIEGFNITHQYVESEFYTESDGSDISDMFGHTPLAFIDYNCMFLKQYKDELFYIFSIVGNGDPYYDLYLLYPYTIRLGYIHKDDL